MPDLALLGMVREIDAALLRAAIERTWAHRGTHPVPEALPDPPAGWAAVYQELAQANRLPWATLTEVTAAVRTFVDPVLAGVVGVWSPEVCRWSQEERS